VKAVELRLSLVMAGSEIAAIAGYGGHDGEG
jgi:hypothetical protein